MTATEFDKITRGIDFNQMPQVIKDGYEWAKRALPYYGQSEIVRRVMDLFVSKIKQPAEPAPAPEPKSPAKKSAGNEAQEAIEFLELLLADAQGAEREEIQEAIEYIKILQ